MDNMEQTNQDKQVKTETRQYYVIRRRDSGEFFYNYVNRYAKFGPDPLVNTFDSLDEAIRYADLIADARFLPVEVLECTTTTTTVAETTIVFAQQDPAEQETKSLVSRQDPAEPPEGSAITPEIWATMNRARHEMKKRHPRVYRNENLSPEHHDAFLETLTQIALEIDPDFKRVSQEQLEIYQKWTKAE